MELHARVRRVIAYGLRVLGKITGAPAVRVPRTQCTVCGGGQWEQCGAGRCGRCTACGMVFALDGPPIEELIGRYHSGYLEQRKRQFNQPGGITWSESWVKDRSGIFERFLPEYECQIGAPRRALEVGCAEGKQMEILAGRGWEVTGVEIGEDMATEGRSRGLRIAVGAIETVRFPRRHFHLVVMSHVLEHLRDPVAVVRRMRKWSVPEGRLIVETPILPDFDDRDHLQFFSESTLARALVEGGYRMTESFIHDYHERGRDFRDIIAYARRQ
ncbi:MAG: class I SAM-dependent methyltransferase [Chlamydiota bacterium]